MGGLELLLGVLAVSMSSLSPHFIHQAVRQVVIRNFLPLAVDLLFSEYPRGVAFWYRSRLVGFRFTNLDEDPYRKGTIALFIHIRSPRLIACCAM